MFFPAILFPSFVFVRKKHNKKKCDLVLLLVCSSSSEARSSLPMGKLFYSQFLSKQIITKILTYFCYSNRVKESENDQSLSEKRSFFPKLQEPKGGSGSKDGQGTSGQGLFAFKKRGTEKEDFFIPIYVPPAPPSNGQRTGNIDSPSNSQSGSININEKRDFFPKLQEPKGGSGSKNGPGTSGQGLFAFKKRRLAKDNKL